MFSLLLNHLDKKLKCFVSGKHSQPSLIFVSKAGACILYTRMKLFARDGH
jgi:hypothetical protein